MAESSNRACDEWETQISPFPIGSDILFALHFKHREHPFKFFHGYFKTLYEAQQEQKRLGHDMEIMRCDKFKEKYHIGHDLKGAIL
jgi:hypothetical protein